MIGRINHIAIAVPDVMAAARQWETILGAKVSAPQTLLEHGVRIVFVIAPNGKVELMEPLGEASPIAGFLARNENGGMHHICYEVDDIVSHICLHSTETAARDKVRDPDSLAASAIRLHPVLCSGERDC